MVGVATYRRALVAACLAMGLAVAGCGDGADSAATSDSSAAAADLPAAGVVSVEVASDLAARDDVVVIDVRTPEEYDEGHLEGATRIGLADADFRDQLDELDRDASYLVYCRSDNRSGQAVAVMNEMGFTTVWDMDGGIVAWSEAGQPVV